VPQRSICCHKILPSNTLRQYAPPGNWLCFFKSLSFFLLPFYFYLSPKLGLFFQIALEYSAVQIFYICHSREGGNPLCVWSGIRIGFVFSPTKTMRLFIINFHIYTYVFLSFQKLGLFFQLGLPEDHRIYSGFTFYFCFCLFPFTFLLAFRPEAERRAPIIGPTCAFELKYYKNTCHIFAISTYWEKNKKSFDFFYFCSALPSLLVENY
jgi:hypothetical protein